MPGLSSSQLSTVLKGRTLRARLESLHELNFEPDHANDLLNRSAKVSSADLELNSQAMVLRGLQGDQQELSSLVKWSVTKDDKSRKAVVKGFLKARQPVAFVNEVGRLKRAEASKLMTSFFGGGGQIKDVAEWLAQAGEILKTGTVPTDTDGLWGWIKDAAGTVADAVTGAINTVADAVKAAGKSLVDAVKAAAKWTQSKINDFVEAIIQAGKKVGDILKEALKQGLSALSKFVKAVIEAGKQALDVIQWAINESFNVLKQVLRDLQSVLGSFTSLLQEVARLAANKIQDVVRALIAIGKKVRDFIIRLDRIARDVAKRIVKALSDLGQSLSAIMSAVARATRHIAGIAIDALLEAGNKLKDILQQVASLGTTIVARIIGALKDLGRSLRSILQTIAEFARSFATRLMQGLRRIWRSTRQILEHIARLASDTIQTLLTALLGTGLHLFRVVKTILQDIRSAFQEGLISGLLAIGKSALVLMKEAVKIGASAAGLLLGLLLRAFGGHRGLTRRERAEAMKVFGASINLDLVRLTTASVPADLIMYINGNRPFTTMYVINYKSGTELSDETLIHELTHVWQGVTSGPVYMAEALHSQMFGRAYQLEQKDINKANGSLLKLEREQQAVCVTEYYKGKFKGVPDSRLKVPLAELEPLAKQVFKPLFTFPIFRLPQLNFPDFNNLTVPNLNIRHG